MTGLKHHSIHNKYFDFKRLQTNLYRSQVIITSFWFLAFILKINKNKILKFESLPHKLLQKKNCCCVTPQKELKINLPHTINNWPYTHPINHLVSQIHNVLPFKYFTIRNKHLSQTKERCSWKKFKPTCTSNQSSQCLFCLHRTSTARGTITATD